MNRSFKNILFYRRVTFATSTSLSDTLLKLQSTSASEIEAALARHRARPFLMKPRRMRRNRDL